MFWFLYPFVLANVVIVNGYGKWNVKGLNQPVWNMDQTFYVSSRGNVEFLKDHGPATINGFHIHNVTDCDLGGDIKLSCKGATDGRYIQVLDGYYGRKSMFICPDGYNKRSNCGSVDLNRSLRPMCNGKQECSFPNKLDWYSDPCVGRSKYMLVTYRCVEGPPTRSHFDYNLRAMRSFLKHHVKQGMTVSANITDGVRTGDDLLRSNYNGTHGTFSGTFLKAYDLYGEDYFKVLFWHSGDILLVNINDVNEIVNDWKYVTLAYPVEVSDYSNYNP